MIPAPLIAVLATLAGLPDSELRPIVADSTDSLRARGTGTAEYRRRRSRVMGSAVSGYLSPRGLPPQPGQVVLTDTGLVFRSSDGVTVETFPLVGPVRFEDGRRWRAAAVALAYVEQESAGEAPLYVFRLDGGVFATEGPGTLLDVAARPDWLDTLYSREWTRDRPLAPAADSIAVRAVADRIVGSGYADTLYALFGRPGRPLGLVSERGRSAGRLGEYVAGRDSLALDPARITSEAQLRHALAHELGHRWQSRAPRQFALLWHEVPPIPDPKRYGHGSTAEHQAEAVAFAVHFLQATSGAPPADPVSLLEQYDRMVPGTGLVARYLALQPIYAGHPLRVGLTRGDWR